MRRWLIPAVLALLATPVAALHGVLASEATGLERYTGTFFDTSFDLGFDVSGVEHTPAAAKGAILGLDRTRQLKVVAACGYFIQFPDQTHSPETRAFCDNLYR
jgi:hypothetical protein